MSEFSGLHPGPALLLGTRKGLFVLQSNAHRDQWQLTEPVFLGHIIHHAVLDPRDGRTLMVAATTGHLGPTIFRSTDAGASWQEAQRPPAFDKAAPGEKPRVVSHTFWLTPGHVDAPGQWWAGTSPQALWRSDDHGATWQSVRGFNDHSDYEARTEDPQAGTPDGPILHSILIDPRDAAHMYFGLSGGGVYESLDQGESWSPLNHGLATTGSDPDSGELQPSSIEWTEIGPQHDPHLVQMHPRNPDVLYQQNHCGIYRLERPQTTWTRIGLNMPARIGDIGFVIALHPRQADCAWVFPMDGTNVWPRTSPDGRPAVYMTRDAGASWQLQNQGLPERGWYTVKRQGMCVDAGAPTGLYFGTTSGEVWASTDEGAQWRCLAQHLPEIYAVEAVTAQ